MTAIDASIFPPLRSGAVSRWTTRETVYAHLGLVAFAVAATACWLWADATVPWDSKNHFYPMFRFLADSLARGEAPTWNPYHFGGHPSVADPQSLLFSPTMFLFAWAAPNASLQMFDAAVLAHLLAGGFGVLSLFRRRGWAAEGAVLAAMIYMLGGSASARLQHTGMILSYGMFPIALSLLEAALERRSLAFAAAFAAVAATMALGRDQVAFLFCLTLIGVVIWRAVDAPAPLTWVRRRLGVLTVAALVGAVLMAVPTILTLQLLAASNRPAIAYGVAVTGSLAPINLTTLFAPNVFGSINWDYSYWGPGYETSAEPDWTDRAVNYLFIGVVPFALLLAHGLIGRRLLARSIRPFTLLAFLMLLYALGRATPLFEVMFDKFPGVSLYRRPADATFALNFALAMTSGYLLHRWRRDGSPTLDPRRIAQIAWAGAVCVGFVLLCVGALWFSTEQNKFAPAALHLGLSLGFVALALFALQRAPAAWRPGVAILLVAWTGVELLTRDAASSLNAEPVSMYSVYDRLKPAEEQALAALRADLAKRGAEGFTPRVEILGLPGPWMNASMSLRLEDTIGYNALRVADYQRAIGPGENAGDVTMRQFPETFRGYRCNLAKLLGLEYLMIDRPLSELPTHIPRPKSATPIFESAKINVYRLGASAPRALVLAHVKSVDVTATLHEQNAPDFDRMAEALIDETAMPRLSPRLREAPADARSGKATIVARRNDRVTLDVEAPDGGMLVLHDLDYPGWTATVDGQPAEILRANLLFRGVELSPGARRVEFVFRPFSLANLRAAVHSLAHRGQDE
jgi:hypothetical protein